MAEFKRHPCPVGLECDVQNYAWGDWSFIPNLLGIENAAKAPYAELWMGAHPDLPSRARLDDALVPLDRLIDDAAEEILGPSVVHRFSRKLPFLLKVLSAAAPLSIQVHPAPERARLGFARENEAGVPLSAPNRNYKDENGKPELLVALTDFYGLRGFRPPSEIAHTLETVPELSAWRLEFTADSVGLKTLFENLMTLPQKDVDSALNPLIKRLNEESSKQAFPPSEREHWVLRADREFSKDGHRDRGLFSIYLLNLVRLRPGEGMFLPAGILHAYLQGSGMEIMANSNNVLRGGLTTKHVDVPELLANVDFEGAPAEILHGESAPGKREWVYKTPVEEFELRRVEVVESQPYENETKAGVEILIVIESNVDAPVTLEANDRGWDVNRGQTILIPHGTAYTIRTQGPTVVYKAITP
jgi:mannose-6-phosphate isomerase class I